MPPSNFMVANANMQRFLGLVLLSSLIVGTYLTIQAIDRALGEGTLFRLLFEQPQNLEFAALGELPSCCTLSTPSGRGPKISFPESDPDRSLSIARN